MPSASAPVSGSRLAGVEGLRGIAALSVMLAHTAIVLIHPDDAHVPGAVGLGVGLGLRGVTLFFVLSGFLLYRPFAAAILSRRPGPRTKAFYRNRVLRIWPVYLVILLITGPIMGATITSAFTSGDGKDALDRVGRLTDPVLLLLNATLTHGFVPHGVQTGLSVSWSLVPEVTFYLILPGLAYLGMRRSRRSGTTFSALVPALTLLSIGLVGRVVALFIAHADGADNVPLREFGASWSAVLTNSILANGDLFAMGMVVAVIVAAAQEGRLSDRAVRRLRRWSVGAILLGGVGVLVTLLPDRVGPFFGLACAGLVCYLMLPGQGRVRRWSVRLLETRPFHGLGLISYSVYLWHFPLLCFLAIHYPWLRYHGLGGLAGDLVLVSALTVILSTLTYRYVEAPALRRKRLTERPVPAGHSDTPVKV